MERSEYFRCPVLVLAGRSPVPISPRCGIAAVHCFAWAKPRLSVTHPTKLLSWFPGSAWESSPRLCLVVRKRQGYFRRPVLGKSAHHLAQDVLGRYEAKLAAVRAGGPIVPFEMTASVRCHNPDSLNQGKAIGPLGMAGHYNFTGSRMAMAPLGRSLTIAIGMGIHQHLFPRL